MHVFVTFVFLSLNILIADSAIAAPPPDPLPYYLYQLFTEAPPSPLPDILSMSDRDAADGFVHLARAINILPLAMKNYNYTVQLWALKLDYQWMIRNRYDVKWEWSKSNSSIYPHLYGNTTKQMVVDNRTWTRKSNELWNATILAKDAWLTDNSVRLVAQMTLLSPLILLVINSFTYS